MRRGLHTCLYCHSDSQCKGTTFGQSCIVWQHSFGLASAQPSTGFVGCAKHLQTPLHAACCDLLAELIQCILNSANGLVVNEVYVLQNGKCTNLPMILANKPFVIFAQFLMTKNWSVSCENIVSILFLAFANGMNVGFQSFWLSRYGHSSLMCAVSNKSSCTSAQYTLSPQMLQS